MNNVYRLLEAYRANAFFGMEPRAKPFPPRAPEAISLLPRPERHVRDVKVALEAALATAFPGQSEEEAIRVIEGVLRRITYPGQFDNPSDGDYVKAGCFFDEVVAHLNVR